MKTGRPLLKDSINFHPYSFNRKTGMLITQEGKKLFLENRLRDLFSILLDNQDEYVSKEELMELVWKDTVVTEQSVPKAISDLRKFLMKHELSELRVSTIRKLGYCLHVEAQPMVKSKPTWPVAMPYVLATLLILIIFLMHH